MSGDAENGSGISLVERLTQSPFIKNVLTVFTGTVLAQLLPLLVAPFLTRLYTPDDFGIFALYLSVITVAGVLATARYEMAITLLSKVQEAFSVLVLVSVLGIVTSLVLLILILVWQAPLNSLLGVESDSVLIFLIPIGVLAAALFRAFSYWVIYRTRFRELATGKIAYSGGIAGLQLSAGAVSLPGGLLAGQIGGQIGGALYLFYRGILEDMHLVKRVTLKSMLQMAHEFRKFPIYSLPASLANSLAIQLPVILLSVFFGATVVGLFALTQRVLAAPIAVLGVSVQDVFKERASRDYRETGSCRDIYIKTLKALVALAIVPFTVLFAIAPIFFEVLFGSEWRTAGDYTRILVVLFFLRFVASPLSFVFYIAEKQRHELVWQLCLLLVTGVSLIVGGSMADPKLSLGLYTASYSVMYLVYLMMSYRFSSKSN